MRRRSLAIGSIIGTTALVVSALVGSASSTAASGALAPYDKTKAGGTLTLVYTL